MLSIASSGRSDPSVGLRAPNKLDFRQYANTFIACGLKKQPGNGSGFGSGASLDDLSFDRAPVLVGPDRTCSVGANFGAVGVVERGLGRLKDPLRRTIRLLTGIDLHSSAEKSEDCVLTRWRICGVLAESGRCKGKTCHYKQETSHGGGSISLAGFTPVELH